MNTGLSGQNLTIFPYLWHKGRTHLKKRRQSDQVEYKVCHKEKCHTDCCNQVRVTVTDDFHKIRNGIYLQRSKELGRRPVYEFTGSEKTDYLYFSEDYNLWVINKNLNDTEAFLYGRTNVTCIEQAVRRCFLIETKLLYKIDPPK